VIVTRQVLFTFLRVGGELQRGLAEVNRTWDGVKSWCKDEGFVSPEPDKSPTEPAMLNHARILHQPCPWVRYQAGALSYGPRRARLSRAASTPRLDSIFK